MKRTLAVAALGALLCLYGSQYSVSFESNVACAQLPAITGDVTRPAGSCASTLAAGSASNLNSGTLPAGRLPAHTGDVTSSAGSAALTLAAGSASVLNSGTLPAGRMPALTGDGTTSAGAVALTVTKINGVDQTTAWPAFTPTYTCPVPGTLAVTNTSSTSKTTGKTTFIGVDFTITNIGSCTQEINFTLPNTPAASGSISIFDTSNVTVGACFWLTTSTTARCFKTGGGNFTTVRFVGTGLYQNQ